MKVKIRAQAGFCVLMDVLLVAKAFRPNFTIPDPPHSWDGWLSFSNSWCNLLLNWIVRVWEVPAMVRCKLNFIFPFVFFLILLPICLRPIAYCPWFALGQVCSADVTLDHSRMVQLCPEKRGIIQVERPSSEANTQPPPSTETEYWGESGWWLDIAEGLMLLCLYYCHSSLHFCLGNFGQQRWWGPG